MDWFLVSMVIISATIVAYKITVPVIYLQHHLELMLIDAYRYTIYLPLLVSILSLCDRTRPNLVL